MPKASRNKDMKTGHLAGGWAIGTWNGLQFWWKEAYIRQEEEAERFCMKSH